ncbi:phosphoribosylformylglycinamidine cyclo-ligase [Pseudanabaena sp. FACHB-2040]|uniref:phosphoribosylformylglycinamidine cyclo-ligase n=1 Tax=Pseudanabaena sp. FACHB-2040 TaxID=2692859 RepID=UPI0016852694|nr:phosphoribosylformylglycinamidine cyclo-ligase [Pseudanabaena sp. FACHB-2040]MBD2259990.1 phosphoribosylformylglycinamidine cyclo-ligase [Pseudanabaena sp. FACHB-2040]
MDYKEAGVDVEAGRDFVHRIRSLVDGTRRPEVLGGLGGFSGFCQIPQGYREPVLVSGTDGVGTKLKIAQALNRHDTVGIDLVAMCVNDVLTSGAEPLFFLDYLATSKLEPAQLAQVVEGIANGCRQANCALLGGETAEMPGFYAPGEYDLAGFCVGVVEKQAILDGSHIQIGDVVIGLASQGVHSNGYSLVRRIVDEAPRCDRTQSGYGWDERPPILGGETLGEALLKPTRLYVQPILQARQAGLTIRGMAHITGGGLPENLPRCLGQGQAIQIDPERWQILPIFQWLAEAGTVPLPEMFNTFNMGLGFAVIVPLEEADQAVNWFTQQGVLAYAVGSIVAGAGELLGLPVV